MQARTQQLRLWVIALTRLENRLFKRVSRSRGQFIIAAAKHYAESNSGSVPGWLLERHRTRLNGLLSQHYRVVIAIFGSLALRQVKSRRIERKQAQTIFESLINEWIAAEALRKATMISVTDYDDIRDAIQDGIDAGEGVDAIAGRIRRVSETTPYRASVVARTETHNAAAFGSLESMRRAEQEFGMVMQKVWLPVQDHRTRPAHAAMERHPAILLNEKFNVGGEYMDRPGDPSASAENVIHCRCALAYEEVIE